MRNLHLSFSNNSPSPSGTLPPRQWRLERSQQAIAAAEMANMQRMATKIAAYQSFKRTERLIVATLRQAEATERLTATLQGWKQGDV